MLLDSLLTNSKVITGTFVEFYGLCKTFTSTFSCAVRQQVIPMLQVRKPRIRQAK